MASHFFGDFTNVFDQWCAVFRFQILHFAFIQPLLADGNFGGVRPFLGYPFGATQHVDARIGSGRGHVVLEHHRFAFLGADDGGVHIAPETFAHIFLIKIITGGFFLGHFAHLKIVRRNGHQVVKTVTPVDVQTLRDWSQAVRRVEVAVAQVFLEAPHVGIGGLVEVHLQEVVDVGTFGVDKFAKHAIADHIQGQLLKKVVTTVLQHHTMALGLFGGFHQLPTFVDGFGCGHFCGGVFALLHGVNGHRGVQAPGGGNVHQIDVRAFTHGFPAVVATVFAGFGAASFFYDGLGFTGTFGIFVAQGHNFHPFNAAHAANCTGATIA